MKIIADTFVILMIFGIIISIVTIAVMPANGLDMYSADFEPLYEPLLMGGFLIFFGGFIGVCFTYEHL